MAETATEMSLEACLALDAASDSRHAYPNGLVIAMAGASPRDDVVAANIIHLVGSGLVDGPGTVFDSGQRVRVSETGGYVYPDLVVTCERPSFTDERPRSLTHPKDFIQGTVALSSVGVSLPFDAIYAKTEDLPVDE